MLVMLCAVVVPVPLVPVTDASIDELYRVLYPLQNNTLIRIRYLEKYYVIVGIILVEMDIKHCM